MTEAERIQHLMETPPKVRLTRVEFIWRTVSVALGALSIAALTVALVSIIRVGAVADCTNSNLGARNGTAGNDAKAHITYAQASKTYDDALGAVLAAPPKSATQQAAYKVFIAVAQTKQKADAAYVQTLAADQAYRAAHPLGEVLMPEMPLDPVGDVAPCPACGALVARAQQPDHDAWHVKTGTSG